MDAERDAIEGPTPRLRIVGAAGESMHGARAMIEEQLKTLDSDGALARHLKIVMAITGAPLVVGNATDILIDGPNAYASIFAAIRAATDHIHIESFIFEDLDFNERLSDVLIAKQMLSRMYLTLLSAISYSRKSIFLTAAYFIPDPDTITALTAAAGRGVDVRLLLPGFTDSWLAFHGGRSHYDALLAGGVRIYEHRDALLHAKTAVIDGAWSTIGSSNIDWRSFCHNDEVNAIVLGESFGTEMTRIFHDDVAAAVEVTAVNWARRGTADRLREWLARRWDPLL